MNWLIREDVAQEMKRALKAGVRPTAEQISAWVDGVTAAAGDPPRIMARAGDTAEISVLGVLSEKQDMWAYFFGYETTAYRDIRTSLALAETDPSIKRVQLRINSPGGNVDGLFETIAAIQAFKKPITAVVKNACSAAYALAASTQKIEAEMRASCVGSIGVVVTYLVFGDEVTITSTNAPNKRPDVTTEEGKAIVRKGLDDLHDLFVESIASGRKTTVDTVNKTFGRGGTVRADEAKRLGMIDSIAKAPLRSISSAGAQDNNDVTASEQGSGPEETSMSTPMTLKTLKLQHPEAFEEHAKEVADATIKAERDRVNAHLTMGEGCNAMKTALEAVKSGAAMTQELTAKYLMADRNRADVETRQQESDTVTAATAGATVPAEGANGSGAAAQGDLGDKVVAARKALRVAV